MVLHYIGGYRDGGGSQNNSWSSHDGATWVAQKPLPIAMQGISLAVLNDVLHILGGFTNAAAAFTFQTDNVTNDWQATPNLPRSGEMAGRLVHNGQIYLAAQDRILISSDGLNFSMHGSMPLAPQPMGGTRMTFFNGRFWLVGGSNFSTTEVLSTVYSSTDAKTWTKVGDLPSPKYAGALYSYDGKMFYVAGLNANQTAASEVFMTTDGVNWRLITYAPRPRELVRGVVYKNKMWLIGGMINGVAQKESWTSTDGLTWTNVGALPEGRANGDVVVY